MTPLAIDLRCGTMSAPHPTFADLYEQACSLSARRRDIDALLRAMAQPVPADGNKRERADILHRIIEDPALGEVRGSDNQRLDVAAAQALVSLGRPYADELSVQGQELLRPAPLPPITVAGKARKPDTVEVKKARKPGIRPDRWNVVSTPTPGWITLITGVPWWRTLGGAGLVWGFVEVLVTLMAGGDPKGGGNFLTPIFLGCTLLTVLVPGLLLCWRGGAHSAVLRYLLAILISLSVALMLLLAFVSLFMGGSNAMLEQTGLFIKMALAGVAVRVLLGSSLLAARRSS